MCVQDCPAGLYFQESENSVPKVHNLEFCISCGHCAAICPTNAIIHSGFPQSNVQPINVKNQPSSEEVLEILRTRRSIRVFKDKPVEKQKIEQIINAARFAPTGSNVQSTKYIVVQNKKILNEMVQATANHFLSIVNMAHNPLMKPLISLMLGKQSHKFFENLPELERLLVVLKSGKDHILHKAPVLIMFYADERLWGPDINAQLAIENAALMAHSLGLGSFYTGFLLIASQRDKSIGHIISLPESHKIYGGLAIGYPKYEFKKWIERKTPEVSWL
jgi:nitroreductase